MPGPSMIVGLTGGIASGKTLVSELFAAHGVPVVDTDVIAHEVVAKGSKGLAAVVDQFGAEVLDTGGNLDRARMRQVIFTDPRRKLILEKILHPVILEEARVQLDKLHSDYAILVIPLLVEQQLQYLVDRIVVVDTTRATQVKRLMERDQCSREQARNILANQASRGDRRKVADDIITNDGSIKELELQVSLLHKKLLKLAKSH